MWVVVTTVDKQANKYTRKAYEKAVIACKFQNIVMQQGSRELASISIKHLHNCPIAKEDIRVADNIFGPNLGSLKGKTVHHSNAHVPTSSEVVPSDIMKVHWAVTLVTDIMFINKIPFWVTISRNLNFGTVETLGDNMVPTIIHKIKAITGFNEYCGFHVKTILADPEFEAI